MLLSDFQKCATALWNEVLFCWTRKQSHLPIYPLGYKLIWLDLSESQNCRQIDAREIHPSFKLAVIVPLVGWLNDLCLEEKLRANPNAWGDRNTECSRVGCNESVSSHLTRLWFYVPHFPRIPSPGANVIWQRPKTMHACDTEDEFVWEWGEVSISIEFQDELSYLWVINKSKMLPVKRGILSEGVKSLIGE